MLIVNYLYQPISSPGSLARDRTRIFYQRPRSGSCDSPKLAIWSLLLKADKLNVLAVKFIGAQSQISENQI